ncbi:amino acid adenylation domain-containing protein [Bacillus mobilis]|uniref:non-ribosomal peptide synthetase n=1 Tax=Bacillus mobilis TaxID=2026190 RepID=UPI002E234C59|nr:non-ribosomal peptide synthetase [Bacillus mobilis]MED0939953.1 amino acid adenylation domain-containing protein [Bacillus mobilis]
MKGLNREGIYQKLANNELSMDEAMNYLTNTHVVEELENSKKIVYPLSKGQQALWTVYKLFPDSYAYNVPMAYKLKEGFSIEVFDKALESVMQKHPILRSTFHENDAGEVQQEILGDIDVQIIKKNIKKSSEEDILESVKKEAQIAFNLESGSLLKAVIFYEQSKPSILLINVHHIIFDGLSMQIFMRDLQDFYSKVIKEERIDLIPTEKTYQDFVDWEIDLLQSETGESLKEYWKKQIPEEISPLDLQRVDNEKSVLFEGANYSFNIEETMLNKLKEFSITNNVSLFSSMLSVYSLLLYHYCQREKVLIGTPIANRVQAGFENTIGYFMNMIVVQTKIEKEDTFLSLVKRTESKMWDSLEHGTYPLHQLSLDLGKSKLFNTAFYYQNWVEELESINTSDTSFLGEPILSVHQQGEFDLTLEIIEMKRTSVACFKYNPTIYKDSFIKQMGKHFIELLKNILSNIDKELLKQEILTKIEIDEMLHQWNNTEFKYPKEKCMHELFEEMVLKSPGNLAVTSMDESLSYSELSDRSSQLAAYLQERGVLKGNLVGVYLNRSVDLLISLLAIHKAGATYIPLDPIYPQERINHMIEDSRLSYIVTHSKIAQKISSDNVKKIILDKQSMEIYETDRAYRVQKMDPEKDVAYIIYTSGSTGKPKGVEVLHKGLTNFLWYMKEVLSIQEQDTFLAITTVCFDISNLELFTPIISGGAVEIASDEVIKDGLAIKELLNNKSINVIQGTPSTWRMIYEAGWYPRKDMKILVGGENVDRQLASYLLQGNSKVWNVYGPTETTIWSTISPLSIDKPITIGRPIGNTQLYILDSNLQPVPKGIAGELYIGGDGLAKGYFNQADLTTERFIQHPHLKIGERLYKTGDMVRYLEDGEVEFVGRNDQQVKIRGYRIELGEIEQKLKEQMGVGEAVVVVRKNRVGYLQLIGFIQQDSESLEINTKEIQKSLSKSLPKYMIPSKLIIMKEYPMTLNQKIDRKMLMELNEKNLNEKYEVQKQTLDLPLFEEKHSDVKKHINLTLKNIIAEISEVSIEDIESSENIGEYGFDSIRYTSLSKKIQDVYNIKVNPNVFYQHSTIQNITDYILNHNKNILEDFYSIQLHQIEKDDCNPVPIKQQGQDPVAIIGMSGKMPGCNNLDEFWESLLQDRDLIQEVPASRWNWKDYQGDPIREENKITSRWGGFIPDVDTFDAEFFRISPYEADSMDPQQRLLLESVWETIENAGHKPSELSGSSTGVFIGSSGSDFMGALSEEIGSYTLTGIARSVLANRISYLLNLTGPSEPVDTACSSALVAIHRAVNAIQNGECEQALAGGVNVILTPFASIAASKVGMLSKDGRCKAFDSKANGYVRGEGVGTVLLKPLSQAIKDNDYIYGVIRGTAVNHGGKANSFTAPNPNAQAELIVRAYEKANINPATVSYIEAHGTGTELGDPIEIDGLKQAFSTMYERLELPDVPAEPHCAIGSVKSNIGHLEAAAGIAGLIKVLLSMQHEILPSNIHLKNVNPYIDLSNSPFYLVTNQERWKEIRDSEGNVLPMRAGVSSFGFGGSNAHVVVEDYKKIAKNDREERPYIIMLSAKTEEQLRKYVERLKNFLDKEQSTRSMSLYSLKNIAYTLQVGREELKTRFAIIVSSINELKNTLKQYLNGTLEQSKYFYGVIKSNKKSRIHLSEKEIESYIKNNKLNELCISWTSGNEMNWDVLYSDYGEDYQRVPLPTYPFSKDTYPIHSNKELETISKIEVSNEPVKALHPMLSRDNFSGSNNEYKLELTGKEYYIKDHVINDAMVMPGVAYIELAIAMSKTMHTGKINKIKDVIWVQPVIVPSDEIREVNVHFLDENQEIKYSFASNQGIHSNGKLSYIEHTESLEPLDLASIQERCSQQRNKDECYSLFRENAFEYGPAFQVIQDINFNSKESLATVKVPDFLSKDVEDYTLHPSILDGALQTVIMLLGERKNRDLILPFAIKEVTFYNPLVEECYIYAVLKSDLQDKIRKYDIYITNVAGEVLVHLHDYSLRVVVEPDNKKLHPLHLYKQNWIVNSIEKLQDSNKNGSYMVIFDKDDERYKDWKEYTNLILVKPGKRFIKESSHIYQINPSSLEDYGLLLESLISEIKQVPEQFVYLWALSLKESDVTQKIYYSAQTVFGLAKTLIRYKNSRKTELIYLYDSVFDSKMALFDSALSGMAKTIEMEQPQLSCKIVDIPNATNGSKDLYKLVENEYRQEGVEILYRDDVRYVKGIEKISNLIPAESLIQPHFKKSGVYVVTGGAGALSILLIQQIAKQAQGAVIVLLGRSDLTLVKQREIEKVKKLGVVIEYIKTDVTKEGEVKEAFSTIKENYKKITGVIHAAGIIKDSFIIKKSVEDLNRVISPKVHGVLNIDEETKDMNLEFFVLFSSISSITGNIGQSDYAFANNFLDSFANWRESMYQKGKRFGKTISINWPLWKNGGMMVNQGVLDMMKEKWGVYPLSNENGLKAFEVALQGTVNQLIVLEGEGMKIDNVLNVQQNSNYDEKKLQEQNVATNPVNEGLLLEQTVEFLKEMVSKATKVPTYKIDDEEPFEVYGIDSVMILNLNTELETQFGEISKTLFFEYQNIQELSQYFIENHYEVLIKILDIDIIPIESFESEEIKGNRLQNSLNSVNKKVEENTNLDAQRKIVFTESKQENASLDSDNVKVRENTNFDKKIKADSKEAVVNQAETFKEDIAIIGISGQYPMAKNLEEFWQNLQQGRNCITEIPKDRWDYKKYFNEEKGTTGKTYSKWGGFLEDVDKFDPLFFNVSPLEAQMLDPQERLFIQTVWHTLEDSGYTRKQLENYNVGVFAGVMWGQYQLYGGEIEEGVVVTPTSSYASIANRISYFFNFHGPSIALDTMCSSSLTTIHLACESIRNGESDMAIAGGVNLTIHPNKHIFLSQTKFASTEGLCRSFGEGGDGYVPGEGVGAILLKPLNKAIEDNDQIYAVVKGSVVNHGGKTNGYTVPNPKAQEQLILQAIEKTGVNPRTISYIEAHGTGTALGDPIEITGLTKAFGKYTVEKQFCSIGSVKSNIGHCESAAGIAGITKMVLQMKHKQLVPSIHSEKLNPNINFENTPFYVQQTLEEWEQPVIVENGQEIRYPRRTGISSFGAGGANAHIVLEEYIPSKTEIVSFDSKSNLFVLSAKNQQQLHEYVGNMINFLQGIDISGNNESNLDHLLSNQISILSEEEVNQDIIVQLSNILMVSPLDLDMETPFIEYGLDPVSMKKFINEIEIKYQVNLDDSQLMPHTNVLFLGKQIYQKKQGIVAVNKQGISFTDVIFTLQTGREAMEERLAIVCSSIEDLLQKLIRYYQGNSEGNKVYYGNADEKNQQTEFVLAGVEGKQFIRSLIMNKHMDKLAVLWVAGMEIDWNMLYGNSVPKRITLPKYPFAKERCWVTDEFPIMKHSKKLHPLLDEIDVKLSLNNGVVFKTQLTAEMKNKYINQDLSRSIYLEMVQYALEYVDEKNSIDNIYFINDISEDNETTSLYLYIHTDGTGVKFEVRASNNSNEEIVCVKGDASSKAPNTEDLRLSISSLLDRFSTLQTDKLLNEDIDLEVTSNNQEMLVKWKTHSRENFYNLEPVVVDGVTKLIKQSFLNEQQEMKIRSIKNTPIFQKVSDEGYVYIKNLNNDEFNIAWIDTQGVICTKWESVCFNDKHADPVLDRFFYEPSWKREESQIEFIEAEPKKIIIMYSENAQNVVSKLKESHPNDTVYTILLSSETVQESQFSWNLDSTEKGMEDILMDIKDIDQVYFLGGIVEDSHVASQDIERFEDIQEKGIVALHRLIHVLEKNSMLQNGIDLKVITNSVHSVNRDEITYPYSAALIGYAKSLAKEYRNLKVSCIDITLKDDISSFVNAIKVEPSSARVKEIAIRQDVRYEKILLPDSLAATPNSTYQYKGIYMIIGGMGNVGFKLCEYLADKFSAKLVVTGRTPLNSTIQEKINKIKDMGGELLYIEADLTDLESMKHAVEQSKAQFGALNGVIHSAMNFSYEKISNISENKLREELGSKAKGSVVLYNVLKNEPLDFLMFFSSGESFTGNIGWSSYAAGCTFKDAFASYVSSQVSYPVQIINWGFWKNDQDDFMELLVSKGVHPIETNQGMEALERVLAHHKKQVMALNVEDRVLELMGVRFSEKVSKHSISTDINTENRSKVTKEVTVKEEVKANQLIESFTGASLKEKTESYVKSILSKVLKLDSEKIENTKDFSYYGVDSLIVTDIHQEFEKDLDEKLLVTLLLENTNVKDVAAFLLEKYENAVINRLGEDVEIQLQLPNENIVQNIDSLFAESNIPKKTSRPSDSRDDLRNDANEIIKNPNIEVIGITEHSNIVKTFYDYGDSYKEGSLKQMKDRVIDKSNISYDSTNMYHLLVNTSLDKKAEVFIAGEGTPILLIPAIGLTAPVWSYQFRDWSEKYQLIVIHHPGYGISELTKDVSAEVVSTVFHDVLQALGIERDIHVIGSCFGGVAAQHFAKEYPNKVASLTLSGSFYQNFGLPDVRLEDLTIEQMIEGASMIAEGVNRDFDAVIEHEISKDKITIIEQTRDLLVKSQCVDPLVVMRYVTQILTLSGKPWLSEIKAPTLCIAGDCDTIVQPSISKEISTLVPDGKYIEITGSGHYPYLTHTKEFDKNVLSFIEQFESATII